VIVTVRCENPTSDFDGIEVKDIAIRNGGKPDIFTVVFPVGVGAPSLFAFPGDAVADDEVLVQGSLDGRRGIPVATDVNGSRFFKQPR